MGEGGAVWFPAPFLQFKESPPRDDPHSEGGGDWPASAQTKVALQHVLQKSERAQKAGHGAGSCNGTTKARENVLLFSPISHMRGDQESKDSMFLTWFTGGRQRNLCS